MYIPTFEQDKEKSIHAQMELKNLRDAQMKGDLQNNGNQAATKLSLATT